MTFIPFSKWWNLIWNHACKSNLCLQLIFLLFCHLEMTYSVADFIYFKCQCFSERVWVNQCPVKQISPLTGWWLLACPRGNCWCESAAQLTRLFKMVILKKPELMKLKYSLLPYANIDSSCYLNVSWPFLF